jgi:hypothetical protein
VLREDDGVAEGVAPFGVVADEAIGVEPIEEVARELGYNSSHAAAPRGVLRASLYRRRENLARSDSHERDRGRRLLRMIMP